MAISNELFQVVTTHEYVTDVEVLTPVLGGTPEKPDYSQVENPIRIHSANGYTEYSIISDGISHPSLAENLRDIWLMRIDGGDNILRTIKEHFFENDFNSAFDCLGRAEEQNAEHDYGAKLSSLRKFLWKMQEEKEAEDIADSIPELIDLVDEAKKFGLYSIANSAFALLLEEYIYSDEPEYSAFLETDDKDGSGGTSQSQYDLVSLQFYDKSVCIPVPLVSPEALVCLFKKGMEVVGKENHNRASLTPHESTEEGLWEKLYSLPMIINDRSKVESAVLDHLNDPKITELIKNHKLS